jgi:predicted RNA-binding Zn-ribbon protein involved in translation (DUF1610 family)
MSNDREPSGAASAIRSFFDERQAKANCPTCGNATWLLMDSPDSDTTLPVIGNLPNQPYRGHKMYSFVCRNCGYVRMHLRSVVDGTIDLRIST